MSNPFKTEIIINVKSIQNISEHFEGIMKCPKIELIYYIILSKTHKKGGNANINPKAYHNYDRTIVICYYTHVRLFLSHI
jgi:hypothetical protein